MEIHCPANDSEVDEACAFVDSFDRIRHCVGGIPRVVAADPSEDLPLPLSSVQILGGWETTRLHALGDMQCTLE